MFTWHNVSCQSTESIYPVPRRQPHSKATADAWVSGRGSFMKPIIFDLKSGGLWVEHEWQLGAYAIGRRYGLGGANHNTAIPALDGACLLQVNAKGVSPRFLTRARLTACSDVFLAIKRIYDDQLAADPKQRIKDTYELFAEGEVKRYPRVTAILKHVINRPALNGYIARRAVEFTLDECIRKKRTPSEMRDDFANGFFDPFLGSRSHMEARGEEGRNLHKCVEGYLLGNPPEIAQENEWLLKAYNYFVAFAQRHQMRLFEDFCEFKVWHETLGFAGTGDFIATIEPCNQKCCEPWRTNG